ncbi:MAG: hypothetical protein V1707_01270 [bacterium]
MKKNLYIIPGWKEGCQRKPYQSLASIAKKKGYEVVFYNVNWNQRLSSQIFPIPKNAVVFGFSLGAVLAWLVAQNFPCRHLILASMTPHSSWKDREVRKTLVDLVGSRFVNDVTKNLGSKHQAKRQTIMYGSLEKESGNIIVPNTGHELSDRYIKKIARIL